MNNSSKFKILFIIVILCGLVFGVLYFTTSNNDYSSNKPSENNGSNTDDGSNEEDIVDNVVDDLNRPDLGEGIVLNQILPLEDYGINTWLISTINKYLSYNLSDNSTLVYNMLNSMYITSNGISLENAFNQEYKNINFSSFDPTDISYYNNGIVTTYFVYGNRLIEQHSGLTHGDSYVFIVQVDSYTGAFSMMPTSYKSLNEAEADSIKSSTEIVLNNNNLYVPVFLSPYDISKYLFNDIKYYITKYPEIAYSKMLISEDNSFTNYDEFSAFIYKDISLFYNDSFISFDVDESDGIVIEVESYNFDYIFYIESVYNYKVVIE